YHTAGQAGRATLLVARSPWAARDGLAPGAGAQQSQAVEADDDGGALVAEDAERQRQVPGQVPGGQGGDDGCGDEQVRGDHAAGAAREGDHGGDGGQVVAHDDGVGGVQGK